MKLEGIWPRHMPKGLELSRDEYRRVKQRANLARKRQRSYRGLSGHNAGLYFPVALPAIVFYGYLMFYRAWHLMAYLVLPPVVMYSAICRQRTLAPFMRRALCEAGYEVCLDCGYLLRGLPDDVAKCPECASLRIEAHRELARQREADETLLSKPRRERPQSM